MDTAAKDSYVRYIEQGTKEQDKTDVAQWVQTTMFVVETKEHEKFMTCLTLYELGNCLLSGSADKTIRMWQMLQRNLECIEVIPKKEFVRNIDCVRELIFSTIQSRKLKVIEASRQPKDEFKNKHVKCITVEQGKVYAGCLNSSIEELMVMNHRLQEMEAPSKSWMQNKPINSISIYKDWVYSAILVIDSSKIKDRRRNNTAQTSIVPDKGALVRKVRLVKGRFSSRVVKEIIFCELGHLTFSMEIGAYGVSGKVDVSWVLNEIVEHDVLVVFNNWSNVERDGNVMITSTVMVTRYNGVGHVEDSWSLINHFMKLSTFEDAHKFGDDMDKILIGWLIERYSFKPQFKIGNIWRHSDDLGTVVCALWNIFDTILDGGTDDRV
ncbi:hypothetical protein C2S52_020902 [Perilla frutescens var. hirtella]|nr:hypothetical protein C2S52_020902 [Perilla frutescens var. hirtella]